MQRVSWVAVIFLVWSASSFGHAGGKERAVAEKLPGEAHFGGPVLDCPENSYFSPQGEILSVNSKGDTVTVYHPVTGKALRTLSDPTWKAIYALKDGKTLGIFTGDGKVLTVDTATGKKLTTFTPDVKTKAIGFDDEGNPITVTGKDLEIRDTDGKLTRRFALPNDLDPADKLMAGARDGYLAIAAIDPIGMIHYLDAKTGRSLHSAPLAAGLSLIQDLKSGVGIGGDGNDVNLLSLPGLQKLGALKGHTASVSSATFVRANYVVSTDSEGEIRLWDQRTQQTVFQTKLPTGPGFYPSAIGVSPDGRHFAISQRLPNENNKCRYLVWDLQRNALKGKFAELWEDLGSKTSRSAFRAIQGLATKEMLPEIQKALEISLKKAVPTTDLKALDGIVAKLDSEKFKEREIGYDELMKLGESVFEHPGKILDNLQQRIEGTINLELRRRLEKGLASPAFAQLRTGFISDTETLQNLRAIEAVGMLLNGPDAEARSQALALLRMVAAGAPHRRETHAARALIGS